MGEKARGDSENARISAVIDDWAQSVGRGDYAAWLSHFTDDAVLMPPGHESLRGKAAIDAFVRQTVRPEHPFEYKDQKVERDGDLAVVASTFVSGDLDAKDVVVLRREPGGNWRIARVIYNLNPVS